MNILEGWKAYIAGIGLILIGGVGLLLHYADPANAMALSVDMAISKILEGLGIVGIRKSVQKATMK